MSKIHPIDRGDNATLRRRLVARLNSTHRLVVDAKELSATERSQLSRRHFDVVIAGGGPAGIQTAVELSRRGVHTLLMERGLFLESEKTLAMPAAHVREHGLDAAVLARHRDAGLSDYLGWNFTLPFEYCVLDPRRALHELASRIDPRYCLVLQNCGLSHHVLRNDGRVTVHSSVRDYRLRRYSKAVAEAPLATRASCVDPLIAQRHDPDVYVDYARDDELASTAPRSVEVTARMLVDACGHASPISHALRRQQTCNVWKCLVYDLEGVSTRQRQLLWSKPFPTASASNFWVDVLGDAECAVGVMVLAKTSPEAPDATPSRPALAAQLQEMARRSGIDGRIVRERYGLVPMTDLREPSAHDRVLFLGASATRQLPNTGFGFGCCLEDATLAAPTIATAVHNGDCSRAALQPFDVEWLRRNEKEARFENFWQSLHLGIGSDAHFHELSRHCAEGPRDWVQRRFMGQLEASDLWGTTRAFLRHPELLEAGRIRPEHTPELRRHVAGLLYCVVADALGVYEPEASQLERSGGLARRARHLAARRVPEELAGVAARWVVDGTLSRLTQRARPLLERITEPRASASRNARSSVAFLRQLSERGRTAAALLGSARATLAG